MPGAHNQVAALQANATANGNGGVAGLYGYDGTPYLFVSNGAGTCTVTVSGSLDAAFVVAQDALTLGVIKLADSTSGTNVSRSILSGVILVPANTSILFQIADELPNIRAVISAASGLGAGSSDTGCTVTLYALEV